MKIAIRKGLRNGDDALEQNVTASRVPIGHHSLSGVILRRFVRRLAEIVGAFLAGIAFAEFKDEWPCEEAHPPSISY